MEDKRFKKMRDPEKYFTPMCRGCGLCCVGKDWSTDWVGEKVGICGNLNIKTGDCIDETKKSIVCRTYICKDFEAFVGRIAYIISRDCPTASRIVQETLIRKRDDFTQEEMAIIQKTMSDYKTIDKGGKVHC